MVLNYILTEEIVKVSVPKRKKNFHTLLPQPGTHAGATPLALLHLLLHSVQGRLVPLRLSIQNIFITSPDEDCLPHLPREAVPGSGSYPSRVYWFLPPVFTVLMLFHK